MRHGAQACQRFAGVSTDLSLHVLQDGLQFLQPFKNVRLVLAPPLFCDRRMRHARLAGKARRERRTTRVAFFNSLIECHHQFVLFLLCPQKPGHPRRRFGRCAQP